MANNTQTRPQKRPANYAPKWVPQIPIGIGITGLDTRVRQGGLLSKKVVKVKTK